MKPTTRETFVNSHGEEVVKWAEFAAFVERKSANWSVEPLYWLSRGESLKIRLKSIPLSVSVVIDGGCVSQVLSSCPFINVEIIDYDNERASGKSSREIDGEYKEIVKDTPFDIY